MTHVVGGRAAVLTATELWRTLTGGVVIRQALIAPPTLHSLAGIFTVRIASPTPSARTGGSPLVSCPQGLHNDICNLPCPLAPM